MLSIDNFLNSEGKILTWPAKQEKKKAILRYMSSKFDVNRMYTEKEVNEIITRWHEFNDLFILRRGMVDMGYIERTKDGKQYWRKEDTE